MMKKLDELNIEPELAELQRTPLNTEALSVDHAKTVLKMIDAFEEDEDVANVYHNLEMTEELEQALNEE
jgi:transcriptional/translational regulatory protein YebC/TACO1